MAFFYFEGFRYRDHIYSYIQFDETKSLGALW